jgi:signal transduction histidine kinase/DNA-binding NarL/FixJ family response regulator
MENTHMDSQIAQSASDEIAHPIMVLLVDDQSFVAELLRRQLINEKDISLHYCQDPQQALSTAEKIGPTVILLDFTMPEIDGITLCRIIRAHPSTRDIPIVMLSSNDDPVTKAAAFAAGANDYLVKLLDSIELIARLRYHSAAYINKLQRDDAYRALRASQMKLEELNIQLLKLASFPRMAPNPILEVDAAGAITYLNPVAEKLFPDMVAKGLEHPLLNGQEIMSAVSAKDGQREAVRETVVGDITYELHVYYVEESKLIRINVLDISWRKRAETEARQHMLELTKVNADLRELNSRFMQAQSQLMQSEKMASIGMLAAGVAHEINNPIGYVQSNLNTLETYIKKFLAVLDAYERVELSIPDRSELFAGVAELKEGGDITYLKRDVLALLAESHEGVDRVKKIVLNLKDFSRIDAEEKWVEEDIHRGLDSTLSMIWNELKYKCEVKKEYAVLPPVECLLPELNQVFMNLLVNAAQAIETRGTITIRTGSRDGQVWIEIADTGKGIPPEDLNRIFEPFFTTKPVGKGTGLGLSVSFSIVQKHHGKIEVESTPGKGAVFRVILPVKQPVPEDKNPPS